MIESYFQKTRKIRLLLLLGLAPALCGAQINPSSTGTVIYERAHLSVVVIITGDKDNNPAGQGSGFIVAKDRIVTNHHVLEKASRAIVIFADGASAEIEGIVADSPTRDLMILSAKTGTRSPLRIGDELSLRQGDTVYALGAPRGLELSITNGIVSGFRHIEEEFMIQNTAPIAPGSSGGPLFDREGRVIGVTTSLLSDSPGIYFAIGAGDVSRLLRAPNAIITPLPLWPTTGNAPTKPELVATGLFVSSEPAGADVFIDGVKQSGRTPVTLPLASGKYTLVLRLPGHEPYAGSVQVKDDIQTRVDAELRKRSEPRVAEETDLSGTYKGSVRNTTANLSANFNITIRRDNEVIYGCMVIQRPLYGSGALRGSVDGDGVSFETVGPHFKITFQGTRTGDKITGRYRVTWPAPQDGRFELQKESSEVPPPKFNPKNCLVDSLSN